MLNVLSQQKPDEALAVMNEARTTLNHLFGVSIERGLQKVQEKEKWLYLKHKEPVEN